MPDDRDDQVRALFHRIDDGPPLDIDVHDVMARGKRVRARRTGLAVVGSTLAVAGAVVVSLSVLAGARSPNLVPADPPSVTSSVPEQPPAPPSGTTSPPAPAPDASAPPDNAPPSGNVPPAPSNGDAEGDGNQPLPEDVTPPPDNAPGGGS
jgi:hypothetical protein